MIKLPFTRFRLPHHLRDTRQLNERSRYDLLSSEIPDFILSGENPLIWQNELRFPYFQKHFGDLRNRLVLDLGCGWGFLMRDFQKQGAQVVGYDLSRPTLKLNVRQNHPHCGPQWVIQGRAEELPFKPVFDLVTATDVLEHVDNFDHVLSEVSRVLKPGGRLGFVTVNKTSLAKWVYITMGERVLKLLPRGTHRFANFIAPEALRINLERQGMEIQDLRGILVNPFLKKYHFWLSLQIEYIGVARKL